MAYARLILGGLMIAVAVGCESTSGPTDKITIHTDSAPGARIPPTGKYSWSSQLGKLPEGQGIDKAKVGIRVREAVERHLGSKGYELKGVGYQVDFLVAYEVILEGDLDPAALAQRKGYGTEDWGDELGQKYEKGSLVIDVLDPKTNKLIWRGVADAELAVVATEEQKRKRVDEAVKRILQKFPPKQ
ncbi:MAG: DUF4136 domain-containing protein [Phycisphaerae bacterium]|nr:DUF4136 domain-containing protein [Phycisphaerae bacterium]